ncbi:MAG: CoA transferase [Dehalococcoidia bacterium]
MVGSGGGGFERATGPGTLDGVRVVDFTEYIAGPYGTMMLADMGAEVVKVEPTTGDHWRHQAPVAPNESRPFLGLNRGKRSVAIDVREARGRAIVHRLVETADAVVLNFRPGVPERLGLDYETLSVLNPRLVYADITAFGHHGPYSHRGGFDLLSQAAAGVMAYEGRITDGAPTGVRTFAPSDVISGMYTAFAVVSALYRRVETGRGQAIATNLFASALSVQYRPLSQVEEHDVTERTAFLALVENARADGATYEEIQQLRHSAIGRPALQNYYRVYPTADGFVAVACLNNRLRRALRDAAGVAVSDPSVEGSTYDPSQLSTDGYRAVRVAMEAAFLERTTVEWLERLDEVGVPAAPFNLTEELYDDPHVVANDLIPTFEHPTLGAVRTPRTPVEMSESRTGSPNPAPTLGADTAAVLAELGVSEQEMDALESDGLIVRWRLPEGPAE